MEHRLYRSRKERILGGVAGGLGEYLGLDPVIVRVLFILLALATGWGALLYVILLLVVPEAPEGVLPIGRSYHRLDARERGLLVGGTLVALGLVFLARELGLRWWVGLRHLWPLLLVAAGVALLIDHTRNR